MATLFGLHPFLLKLYADGGCQGPIFQSAVRKILRQIDVEIVKRSDLAMGFAVLPTDNHRFIAKQQKAIRTSGIPTKKNSVVISIARKAAKCRNGS